MGRDIEQDAKHGFTIVELLIVVAIIALLFALLIPALSRVRMSATYIVCGSNLSQIVKAGLIYLGDNKEVFPEDPNEWLYTKASISKEHPIGCRWHDRTMSYRGEYQNVPEQYQGKMWKYIAETRIGPCPIFRDIAKYRGCENPEHNNKLDIVPQYSYTMNGYLGSKEDGGVLNVSEVRKPGEVFFFAEESSWSIRPDHPKYPAKWLNVPLSTKALDDTILLITPTPQAGDCFAGYHNAYSDDLSDGYCNVAFVDGHVSTVRIEEQLRQKMHGVKRTGNPAGNLSMAWASNTIPPSGWDGQ